MVVFATLGPAGTNHELVTRRFLDFHGIADARIELVSDFKEAIAGLRDGSFDYVVQCAVHPDTPATLGENFRDVFAIDSFIAPSKPLAVLTRKDVATPRSIGLLRPSTEGYIDVSRWDALHSGPSIPVIFDGLLDGRYDSALVYQEYAESYPDRVRIDEVIGSPDDVWIVYGMKRASDGGVLAWRDSPLGRALRNLTV